MSEIKFMLGFIAAKIGISFVAPKSDSYTKGWFTGIGVFRRQFGFETKKYGAKKWMFGCVFETRKTIPFFIRKIDFMQRRAYVLSFGFGIISLSKEITT